WPILMFLFSSSIFTMLVSQDNQLSLSNTIAPLTVVFAFLGLPFARGASFNKLSAKTIFGLLLVVTLLVIVPLILGYLTVSHSEFAFSHTTLTIICGSCAVLNLAVALSFRQIAKLFLGWSTIWLLALAGLLLPISAFTVGIAIAGVVLAALLLFYHPEPRSGLIA
ncbi:membrane protein, partial [Lacticaseibacillus rhamnosus]